jgi:iron complex outermembrane receptor protein
MQPCCIKRYFHTFARLKNIHFIFPFIAFLCVPAVFNAQVAICLKDAHTLEAIEGAMVYQLEKDEYRLSDALGIVAFARINEGSRIYIEALGYESSIIVFPDTTQFTVELTPSHISMKELTVTGIGTTTRDKSGFRIDKIDLKNSSAMGQLNIPEALSLIPGVYSANLGNGIAKPVIRGMQGMRVVTMLNAMRFEAQQWGGDHGIGIGNAGVGSAEVIKGPASLVYGADAMGGVVILNDMSPLPVGEKSLAIKTQYQHVSRGAMSQFSYQQSGQRWRFLFAGGASSHSDFGIPKNLYAKNSRFQDLQGRGYASYSGDHSVHYVRYAFNVATTGIPGHTHDSLATPADFQISQPRREWSLPAQFIRNHIVSQENKWYFTHSEFHLNAGYARNNLIEFDEKVSIPSLSMRLDNFLSNIKYVYRFQQVELSAGSQWMHQINSNMPNAEEELIPNSTTTDFGAYITAAATMTDLNIQCGVRMDSRQIIVPGDTSLSLRKNYQGYNYAVGMSYPIGKWIFRTSLASGFRIPHVTELLANGYHHGALRFEQGNRFLNPEYATQVDCSAEWSSEHTTIMLNPYVNHIRNYIYIKPTSERMNGMPVFIFTSAKETMFAGGEASVHFHPHFAHDLHIQFNGTLLRLINSDSASVSLMPQPRISGDIRYDLSAYSKGQVRIDQIGIRTVICDAQRQIAIEETSSPAYATLDGYFSISLGTKRRIQLEGGCKNITDTRYIDHLSRLKNIEMPFPGRNIYFGIQYKII